MTERDRALIERLAEALERLQPDAFAAAAFDRRRLMRQNLLLGLCRGLGFTLGFSVLGALLAVLLRSLVVENIPLIGGFLAEVIHAIEARM